MWVAGLLFALMFLNYGLNAISIRLLTKGNYLGVGVTDAFIAGFGFWMINEVAHTPTVAAFAGYVLGGVSGSLTGLWLTREGR